MCFNPKYLSSGLLIFSPTAALRKDIRGKIHRSTEHVCLHAILHITITTCNETIALLQNGLNTTPKESGIKPGIVELSL
ncbi:hypothetical protein ACHAW6_013552 [Cyclotella cf. meneghiniana]